MPGIGNDIKKPGADEVGYDRTPLKALASQLRGWREIRADLGKITAPLLVFRATDDHVVDATSLPLIQAGVSSTVTEYVTLENSYHVATLDHDAPAHLRALGRVHRRARRGSPMADQPDDFDEIVQNLDLDLSFPDDPPRAPAPERAASPARRRTPKPRPRSRSRSTTCRTSRSTGRSSPPRSGRSHRGRTLAWVAVLGSPLAIVLFTLAHVWLPKSVLLGIGLTFVAGVHLPDLPAARVRARPSGLAGRRRRALARLGPGHVGRTDEAGVGAEPGRHDPRLGTVAAPGE